MRHPYTVDVYLVGAEPYPCLVCGGQRIDPRHIQTTYDKPRFSDWESVSQVSAAETEEPT